MTAMAEKLMVAHVQRPMPPWRDERLTECGRNLTDVELITREEVADRIKKWGRERTRMMTCWTCVDTTRRWKTWDERPGDVIARDVQRGGGVDVYWSPDLEQYVRVGESSLIDRELRAIAALVEEHRDEFDAYLAGLDETTDLGKVRAQREARTRRAR